MADTPEPVEGCGPHVDLVVRGAPKGAKQPVPARQLPGGTVQILHSAGLVPGVAAGDEIRMLDEREGTFEIVRRGGNVCIQIYSRKAIAAVAEWISPKLNLLGGRLDGRIERAAVFTVPVQSGFRAMEEVMEGAQKAFPEMEWTYGNVYADDGATPLNWWNAG